MMAYSYSSVVSVPGVGSPQNKGSGGLEPHRGGGVGGGSSPREGRRPVCENRDPKHTRIQGVPESCAEGPWFRQLFARVSLSPHFHWGAGPTDDPG